jgi:hypothetical protein
LAHLIRRLSTNQEYQPYDLIEALTACGLFTVAGRYETVPVSFRQLLVEYIESFHAQSGLSRKRMTKAVAEEFDRELRAGRSSLSGEHHLAFLTVGEII